MGNFKERPNPLNYIWQRHYKFQTKFGQHKSAIQN